MKHYTLKDLENSKGDFRLGTINPSQKLTINKIYEALMVEKETRQKFKEKKPQGKTNTEYLELLLSKVL
jgi:hypothetical protein